MKEHGWTIIAAIIIAAWATACSDDTEDESTTSTSTTSTTSAGGGGGTTTSSTTTSGGGGGAAPQGPSCAEILSQNPSSPDGTYTLTTSGGTVPAYCDMTGGGWTLAFVSSQTATNKIHLDQFQQDTGAGSLTDNAAHYAIAGFGSEFHYEGIELRLTWTCGTDLGAVDVTGDASQLDSGTASWEDDRTAAEVTASAGEYHNVFSNFSWSGSSCWTGQVRDDYVYGFGIGNGNGYGQYVGWFYCETCFSGATITSAISDGAEDNTSGTVAGWFR